MTKRAATAALIVALALAACAPVPPETYRFFDFERDADLGVFLWQCHIVYGRTSRPVGHGAWALRVDLPPDEFPGVEFSAVPRDWSMFEEFRFWVYVEGDRPLDAMVRIDDDRPCVNVEDRANIPLRLNPGENRVSIPVRAIAGNPRSRRLNVRQIRRIIFFLSDSNRREVLDLDDFRLVLVAGEKGR